VISEATGEKIQKANNEHPALRGFNEPLMLNVLKSTGVRAYFRTDLHSGATLLSLSNGDPLLVERRIGPGRVLLFLSTADRDWTDLPLKTPYLPLVQALVSYLAGNKTGEADTSITVGEAKTFSLPPSLVGKSLKIAKPDGKEREISAVGAGDKSAASFLENDLAGIYRLALQADSMEKLGIPQSYAVNSPFLESRLQAISEQQLRAKVSPIRTEVIPIESLEKGGKRTDLSLPLAFLLIVTLIAEGWLAQRFSS
jgi:hypothetical protein